MSDKTDMGGSAFRRGFADGRKRREAEQVIHEDESRVAPSAEYCTGWNEGYAEADLEITKRTGGNS